MRLVLLCVMSGAVWGSWLPEAFRHGSYSPHRFQYELNQNLSTLVALLAERGGIGQRVTVNNHDQAVALVDMRAQMDLPPVAGPLIEEDLVKKNKTSEQQPQSLWQRFKSWCSGGPSKQPAPSPSGFIDYVTHNKRSLMSKAALCGYLYINYQLFFLSSQLHDESCWSLWGPSSSLGQLYGIPTADLVKELVAEIKRRSRGANPFGDFLQAVATEQQQLVQYRRLSHILLKVDEVKGRVCFVCSSWMPKFLGVSTGWVMNYLASKLQIKYLFYLDEELLRSVAERLNRLTYLKNVFSQWLIDPASARC